MSYKTHQKRYPYYFLVLYRNDDLKQFSVTARKPQSRLRQVNQQMEDMGFVVDTIATDLSKEVADARKLETISEYESKGYTYVKRQKLS